MNCPRCASLHVEAAHDALGPFLACSCCGLRERFPGRRSSDRPDAIPPAFPRSHVRVLEVQGEAGPVRVVLA